MATFEYSVVLQDVIAAIRSAIAEDWIMDYDIHAQTRLGDDLEIESIEFVGIAEELHKRFGRDTHLMQWLSKKEIHELINLTPGDLALHIFQDVCGG